VASPDFPLLPPVIIAIFYLSVSIWYCRFCLTLLMYQFEAVETVPGQRICLKPYISSEFATVFQSGSTWPIFCGKMRLLPLQILIGRRVWELLPTACTALLTSRRSTFKSVHPFRGWAWCFDIYCHEFFFYPKKKKKKNPPRPHAIHGSDSPCGSVILMRGIQKRYLSTGQAFQDRYKIDFNIFLYSIQDHELVKPCNRPQCNRGYENDAGNWTLERSWTIVKEIKVWFAILTTVDSIQLAGGCSRENSFRSFF